MTPKKHELGQGLAEFALLIVLVATVASLTLVVTGTSLQDVYCSAVAGITGKDPCAAALSEDFSDLSDWQIVWGRNWRIEDGKLCGSGWGALFNTQFSGDDYTINLGKANLARGNGYGVFFRAQNYSRPEGYIFQYDPGWRGGAFIFRKWVNGHELYPFAEARMPGYDWHGEDHQITVAVEGNTYIAYVDGQEVLRASDSTYTQGGIGLRTWDRTAVCFDDLTITTP
ncbi:MAG: DUF1080 domain-containing protein [Anaerolineae bacterium]|nr:MAG: DUF1080 domain-containing protein [Anaerolineae bacterium]